jgi:hypothetical protein
VKRARRDSTLTRIITIDDLDDQIEALRAQEQAWKREAQRFEAMIKEISPQLHALVALKRSLTMRRRCAAPATRQMT